MLKINEYDLTKLDTSAIDIEIVKKLRELESCNQFNDFFKELKEIIDKPGFSFVKASNETISKLKKINTQITVSVGLVKLYKSSIDENKEYMLNNILEFIFGYHQEERTQLIKKYFKSIGLNNCVYCLAQYTTSYGYDNKIYVKGNLDHIYPKSLNALVSLSINNLVPVCGHCNQRKLNADLSKFNFNPFNSSIVPYFSFKKILEIDNGNITISNMDNLEIKNINPTLESRLQLSTLYREYSFSIQNILERYKIFNSTSYMEDIEKLIKAGISNDLEYFISEVPFTEENIQNIPLQKFKNDFYKELEEYKNNGKF